ncbi:hypothetical protein IEQ34_021550 [Dendrobium chrysotoxum]|uniref:Uncharacterized protein n=1 Tax=Dendrobium chrysotoxum TaxID=161865 RepID=A0AAV7G662_DENCH|nr:hypothetical protein IEQ34_021550 [Dendrobium chrysotoxum]
MSRKLGFLVERTVTVLNLASLGKILFQGLTRPKHQLRLRFSSNSRFYMHWIIVHASSSFINIFHQHKNDINTPKFLEEVVVVCGFQMILDGDYGVGGCGKVTFTTNNTN